eukprot:gnl/TRDRNA2_/TRDRNA2_171885_c0_seq2.p1 gnl/TRDRNA2_/TRDRNA2_171885_c0~~gnl/TRDRNA2_/TRDRNA2_171885_c0_seq2.p1  ORF type:complete len:636 (+),score=111.77 gnl/TRDRNA2_/TRDRNA2_171885_c0_seq2:119-2026(+)
MAGDDGDKLASDAEASLIQQMRTILEPELRALAEQGRDFPHTTGDIFLLRVLRFNDRDIKKACQWYRECLELRRKFQLDELHTELERNLSGPLRFNRMPHASRLAKYTRPMFNEETMRTDGGDLIYWDVLKHYDTKKMVDEIGWKPVLEFLRACSEKRSATLDRLSREQGRLVRVIRVLDAAGASLWQWDKVYANFTRKHIDPITLQTQCEMICGVFIVNTPWYGPRIYGLVKWRLPTRVQKQVHILGADFRKHERMLKVVGEANIDRLVDASAQEIWSPEHGGPEEVIEDDESDASSCWFDAQSESDEEASCDEDEPGSSAADSGSAFLGLWGGEEETEEDYDSKPFTEYELKDYVEGTYSLGEKGATLALDTVMWGVVAPATYATSVLGGYFDYSGPQSNDDEALSEGAPTKPPRDVAAEVIDVDDAQAPSAAPEEPAPAAAAPRRGLMLGPRPRAYIGPVQVEEDERVGAQAKARSRVDARAIAQESAKTVVDDKARASLEDTRGREGKPEAAAITTEQAAAKTSLEDTRGREGNEEAASTAMEQAAAKASSQDSRSRDVAARAKEEAAGEATETAENRAGKQAEANVEAQESVQPQRALTVLQAANEASAQPKASRGTDGDEASESDDSLL